MPKKQYFERDLKNVNIRRKDFNAVIKLRHGNEPFYSIVHRLTVLTQEQVDLLEEMEAIRESMKEWQQRALTAEKKLNDTQLRL